MALDFRTTTDEARTQARLAFLFIATALLLRLPSFVYSVMNYDESLYILMGSKLAEGTLPYVGICDIKPFGLFAIFALFSLVPFDAVFTSRAAAVLVAGLSAFMLARVARELFDDRSGHIGLAAGLAYIVFSLADGGMAAQGELFANALALLALVTALAGTRGMGPPCLGHFVAAGLILGIGLQVKQVVIFDAAAFFLGFFVLTTPLWIDLVRRVRTALPALLALGVMIPLPTLAVVLVYFASGHLDAWVAGNITGHRVFYGEAGDWPQFDAAWRALVEQLPLWVGAIVACVLAARWCHDAAERRGVVFLAIWAGAVIACQVFLWLSADHYMLQFLPSMGLLTGFAIGRGLLDRLPDRRPVVGLLALLVGLGVFAVAKSPLMNSFYVMRARLIEGEAWAGDMPRQVAADLAPQLEAEDAIYVVGFQPIIYYLTDARIPTRFAFTGMPHFITPGRDGCPWVEPLVEMERILAQKPRFIVVEDGVFYRRAEAPGSAAARRGARPRLPARAAARDPFRAPSVPVRALRHERGGCRLGLRADRTARPVEAEAAGLAPADH